MKKILFQGDSITDCSRGEGFAMGHGYPCLVASALGYENPGEYEFINKGISGNRVVDLLARWKCDCLNLKPDYISIMIGVNDVWHEFGAQNGVDAEKYETVYTMLISDIKKHLPKTKIIILSPYVTHGHATDDVWEAFSGEVRLRREAAQRIAESFGLAFINLQEKFDEVCKDSDPTLWTEDGVHPSNAGHELIKRAWLETFETIK